MVRKIEKDVTLLFLVALLVRVGYAIFFVEPEYLLTEDQALYIQLAQQFPDSGFLGVTSERVPGYPLFIASIYTLFGEEPWNVISIQILLDGISCVVIALMAKSLFSKGFWIAGILSAINLNMVILSVSLLTDTLFLFLFILFLFSLLQYLQNARTRWLILLVLFISLATLVRPSSYYLLPILLIGLVSWRLWRRDTIPRIGTLAVLYLVIVGVLLGGIHQRNYQQYGSTALVSQTGTHLLGWVVPATYQYSGQGSYQEGQQLARGRLASALQRDQLEALSPNPFESSSYQANVGKDVLFELGFLNMLKAWVVGSTINLLAPSVAYTPALRSMEHPSFYETKGNGIVEKLFNYIKNSDGFLYLSILAVGTIISIIFTMLALVGVFKMISALPPITVTTLLLLVGYFFAITGPIIGVKYRLPIEPILTLFVTSFLSGAFFKYGSISKDSH
jgi:4-amino-4-deoxy-L-arabinose transferase-like glycosyltransferase